MRIAKTRVTDYRKGGNQTAPSRKPDGLDHLAEANRREQADHDRAVADFGEGTLRAIGADLGRRHCWDRSNPEHRWTMQRLAAVGRRLATAFA